MLKKRERLNREAFNRFFSIGRRFQSPSFTLIYNPHKSFHASVVVSKKVYNRAVQRNKIRRQMYDIVRLSVRADKKNGVFILILKPGVAQSNFQTIKKEVISLISNIQPKSITTIT